MMKTLWSFFVLILLVWLPGVCFGQTQKGLIVYLGDPMHFNGRDRSVYLGEQFTYQEFAIAAWIRPAFTQWPWAAILDNNHTATRSFAIHQNAGATNEYVFGIHSATSEAAGVKFTLPTTSWTHAILIKDRSSLSAYMNGVLVSSRIIAESYAISYDDRQVLHLGRWGAGGRYWNGRVYHLRIYNRALSAKEVLELWKYEMKQPPPIE
jgi:hypothetical protein